MQALDFIGGLKMEKGEQNDWYHDILTGAMKFIESEEQDDGPTSPQNEAEHVVIVSPAVEVKDRFCQLIQSTHGHGGFARRRDILARGFTEGVRQWVQTEIQTGDNTYYVTVSSKDIPVTTSIPDEEVDEKIAIQLSAVIDQSLVEFQQQRNDFKASIKKSRDEFQQKFLQMSGKDGGDAQ